MKADVSEYIVAFQSTNPGFLPDIRLGTAPILGTVLGEANAVGALAGRTPAGPVTYVRVSTDDLTGTIRAYVGEGQFTDDPLDTFEQKQSCAFLGCPTSCDPSAAMASSIMGR